MYYFRNSYRERFPSAVSNHENHGKIKILAPWITRV